MINLKKTQSANSNLFKKINRRIRNKFVSTFHDKFYYYLFYWSWWHSKIFQNSCQSSKNYLTAIPNQGAGIGHQIANWNAGLWFSHQFGLKFAHSAFPSDKWEKILGFGTDEVTAEILKKEHGYKTVLLPIFDEFNTKDIQKIKKIISSYSNKKIIFILEQDQNYADQFGVMEHLQKKFYQSQQKNNNQLKFSNKFFNIAIHVRRGDISIGQTNNNSNLLMRWQDSKYFEEILHNTVKNLEIRKPIKIYLFSQGNLKDFENFNEFKNVEYCLDMNTYETFLHMVYADLLITSKSSFSYKPALLSRGIKICPRDFWHGYPDKSDWILANESGSFDLIKFQEAIRLHKIQNHD